MWQNWKVMRKLLYIASALLFLTCCTNSVQGGFTGDSISIVEDNGDTLRIYCDTGLVDMDTTTVIGEVVNWANAERYTKAEMAHFDSMNAEGGFLLIREAERHLDTIVNHLHIIFIPEP